MVRWLSTWRLFLMTLSFQSRWPLPLGAGSFVTGSSGRRDRA